MTFISVMGSGIPPTCVPVVVQVLILSATTLMSLFHFMTRFLLRDLVSPCSIRHWVNLHFLVYWHKIFHSWRRIAAASTTHTSWKTEDDIYQTDNKNHINTFLMLITVWYLKTFLSSRTDELKEKSLPKRTFCQGSKGFI